MKERDLYTGKFTLNMGAWGYHIGFNVSDKIFFLFVLSALTFGLVMLVPSGPVWAIVLISLAMVGCSVTALGGFVFQLIRFATKETENEGTLFPVLLVVLLLDLLVLPIALPYCFLAICSNFLGAAVGTVTLGTIGFIAGASIDLLNVLFDVTGLILMASAEFILNVAHFLGDIIIASAIFIDECINSFREKEQSDSLVKSDRGKSIKKNESGLPVKEVEEASMEPKKVSWISIKTKQLTEDFNILKNSIGKLFSSSEDKDVTLKPQ